MQMDSRQLLPKSRQKRLSKKENTPRIKTFNEPFSQSIEPGHNVRTSCVHFVQPELKGLYGQAQNANNGPPKT